MQLGQCYYGLRDGATELLRQARAVWVYNDYAHGARADDVHTNLHGVVSAGHWRLVGHGVERRI